MRPVVLAAALLAGCGVWVTEREVLGPIPHGGATDAGPVPDAGRCEPDGQLADWPVKVMVLVDNVGTLCVLDPPAWLGLSLCYQVAKDVNAQATSGRVQALERFWAQPRPEVALVASLTWWAPGPRGTSYQALPGDFPRFALTEFRDGLSSRADLEGGLGLVKATLEDELRNLPPMMRARSKYVVLVLHSGVPSPLCSADDALTTPATPEHPDGVFPDSPTWTDFCANGNPRPCDPLTALDPLGAVCVPGFSPGGERNQPLRLRALAAEVAALQAKYGVGSVSLHTRLLFDATAAAVCGARCATLFHGWDGGQARTFGRALLGGMADAGGGTFVDPGSPLALDLSDLDLRTLRPTCP